ncbi:hypothetical protein HELRODRAFT_67906 [Helobdella robusta]|uniref:Intraflagellar transport protein 81 homolog n=1 Tax=Helobdella robusta TaxID=6412 RepID=T1FZ75_HELRO|nr:hypothetical protein HELRODRAFT_67906 [Helobdella robusta]ESN96098.1 hypothetical protein HELRODRAFT_67906 [Helobdella robusta]
MSENLKFIVSELNKPPFNRNFSLISFDSLEELSLLQLLTDIFAEIEPSQKLDVRDETPDATAIRIFQMLRIFKYKIPANDQNAFRQGIVEGKKLTIHPIMAWVLGKIPELKERAYLGRYLVKVEIPADFLNDSTIGDLNEQYLALIETFKETHKELSSLKNSGFNTSDIKKDILAMEGEKDQLLRRVEKLKKKVESTPNNESILQVARSLREENDRGEKIHRQKQDQRNLILQMDQRIQRMNQQIKETRQSSIGLNAQTLMNRLEEESNTNKYLVNERLPQEKEQLKRMTNELQRIALEPAMGQSDLDEIQQQVS